jgi:hypothetical protein
MAFGGIKKAFTKVTKSGPVKNIVSSVQKTTRETLTAATKNTQFAGLGNALTKISYRKPGQSLTKVVGAAAPIAAKVGIAYASGNPNAAADLLKEAQQVGQTFGTNLSQNLQSQGQAMAADTMTKLGVPPSTIPQLAAYGIVDKVVAGTHAGTSPTSSAAFSPTASPFNGVAQRPIDPTPPPVATARYGDVPQPVGAPKQPGILAAILSIFGLG